MSGEALGVGPALTRAGTAAVEPAYAAVAAIRNWLFDRGLKKSLRLPRPLVSVGNITTGGTGKTPVVRWLAERLRDAHRQVAVLARGYGARPGEWGDEQVMLDQLLNDRPGLGRVTIAAHPDRFTAAQRVLRERPDVDAFVLDDGFQHRRLARDLDVVLVSATSPFGYDHVLPRGMLREPLGGLRRAAAGIITRADQVTPYVLDAIEWRIREIAPALPIYRATHEHAGFRSAAQDGALPLDELSGRNWFAVCGIGEPQAFLGQLKGLGGKCAGHRWFADHHRYTPQDLADLRREAVGAGADVLLTTEKDWAKLATFPDAGEGRPPVWRVGMRIRFFGQGEALLLDQIAGVIKKRAG